MRSVLKVVFKKRLALLLLGLALTGCGAEPAKPVQLQISFGSSGAVTGEPVSFTVADVPFTLEQIRYYRWYFGDNQNADGQSATHIYASPGTYKVVLQIGLLWDVPVNMKALGPAERVKVDGEHLLIFHKELVVRD